MADTATSRSAAGGTLPEISLSDFRLEPEDLEAVAEALRSGALGTGGRTEAFEAAFAAQLRTKHAVALANCTTALHLAYLAAGVGPGDEVIVPSFTFAATASTVINCGGTPIFADIVDRDRPYVDPDDVEARITPRTKAITVVHFAGYAAAVDRVADICSERGIALIEDAAHTPSATLRGRKLGTWGLAGAFSLFSNKVLATGEGGLLTTDDDAVAEMARRLRSHALVPSDSGGTYDVRGLGYNYRFDDPRAALALSRLGRLEDDIERRRKLTRRYRERLKDVRGISVPFDDASVDESSCYVMPIFLDDAQRRPAFRSALRQQHGIQTSILYPAVHEFTAYRSRFPGLSLPRTEHAARSEVTIPLYAHLTDEDQERVLAAIETEAAA